MTKVRVRTTQNGFPGKPIRAPVDEALMHPVEMKAGPVNPERDRAWFVVTGPDDPVATDHREPHQAAVPFADCHEEAVTPSQ